MRHCQVGQGRSHAARLMKDEAKVLERGRTRQRLAPHMPGLSGSAMEDNNLRLGGADRQAHALAEPIHAIYELLKPLA